MKEDELFRNLRFVPSATRKDGSIPGTLSETTEFGCYKVEWDVSPLPKDTSLTLYLKLHQKNHEFTLYLMMVSNNMHLNQRGKTVFI